MIKRICILSFLFCLALGAHAQLNQEEVFGKNRVQYHKDFKYWWKYETANFITYWYSPARKVAESAILLAEQDYKEIQSLLEHHINDKIQIIVFKDLTDFKQSNLGSSEIFESEAGQTKIDGNRIFIYSNGDHNTLRHQIREGIASVHITQMLQGNTIQEIVQNAFSASLPSWYITGLISYVGSPYDYKFENDIRAFFNEYPNSDFESFSKLYPTLAGHAMWNYIYSKYGATNLSNLLYITRINRKLENSFVYVLGVPFAQVQADCYTYYQDAYLAQRDDFADPDHPEIKIKKKKVSKRKRGRFNLKVTQAALSPDSKTILYVTNELGKYRTWLYDIETQNQTQLLKGSFRNPFQEADYNYPKFTWDNTTNDLYGIEEKSDKLYLHLWDFEKDENFTQVFPPELERVYSIDVFGKDTLLLSATVDGYTDLYFYRPNTRQLKRLTEDYFDDLDAKTVYIGGTRYIVFASNRTNVSLEKQVLDTMSPADQYDLYLLSPVTQFVQNITNTPWASERNPVVESTTIHYISDQNGVKNRWRLDLAGDQLNPEILTLNKAGVDYFTRTSTDVVEVFNNNEDPKIYYYKTSEETAKEIKYTGLAKLKKSRQDADKPRVIVKENPIVKKVNEQFYFQTKFKEEIPLPADFNENDKSEETILILPNFSSLVDKGRDNRNTQKFNSARMLAYRMTFGLTDFEMDLNNELLFSGLNSFTGFKRGFEYPETGILLRAETRDLFENYIVSGGARVPLSFNGTEFFLAIEDRKYQLDRKLGFYRKSNKERSDRAFEDNPDTRNTTHIGVLELNYPFSIFSSLRLTTTLRFDRTIFLPDENTRLDRDDINQQRIGLRLEYIFDNTYQQRPNILNGTRAKIYAEGTNKFQLQFDPWTFDLSQATMAVFGIDVRHYMRLDRHSILAIRAAGATSMGSEKILYYLGGVRNWIAPQYNDETPFPAANNFAFQAAANDMRGFKQNIRNGASYALANVELRVPFFNYFSRNDIKSKFFRNFQIVGFADAGTAWHGKSPTSEGNPLNIEVVTNATSTATITYYRDPLVVGYGVGARINLLGYFLRLDYAWGFETRRTTDPIFYLSMGHDF